MTHVGREYKRSSLHGDATVVPFTLLSCSSLPSVRLRGYSSENLNFIMPSRSNGQQQAHWAMQLHNELQRQGRLRSLSWDDQVEGPSNNAVWTSTVFLHEIEYGRGTASTRQGARDMAARRALRVLEQEIYGHNGY